MKKYHLKINCDEIIDDPCFKHIGKSKIDGKQIYTVSYYSDSEIFLIRRNEKINNILKRGEIKRIPVSIKGTQEYLKCGEIKRIPVSIKGTQEYLKYIYI